MSNEFFVSGTILEFKVPLNLGYAYCKILDFRHIRMFDGVLVKVYNYITKNPINDLNLLTSKDLLFGARRMPNLPATRGKGAWRIKGVLISQDDADVPDFKNCIKSSGFLEDESKVGPWDVIRDIRNVIPSTYKKVKHLEDTIVSTRPTIEIRTAMEYCRINNIDVKEKFDLTLTINDLVYKQMLNVPIYAEIPKSIRGKALD